MMEDHGVPLNINVEDLLQELHSTQQRSRGVDVELLDLVKRQEELQKGLVSALFPLPHAQVDRALDEGASLQQRVTGVNIIASDLSLRVRILDTAQSRLQTVLSQVEALLNLTSTIEQIRDDMERSNFAAAAGHLHRALRQQPFEIATSSSAPSDSSGTGGLQNVAAYQILEHLQSRLLGKVQETLQAARQRQRWSEAKQFSVLLPLLGEAWSGLDLYCQDACRELRQIIQARFMSSLTSSMDRSSPALKMESLVSSGGGSATFMDSTQHPEAVAQLLDLVAQFIKREVPKLRADFCLGSHFRLLMEIQNECDDHIGFALTRFAEDRRVEVVVNQIRSSHGKLEETRASPSSPKSSSEGTSGKPVTVNPRHLDEMLEELAYLGREVEILDFNLRSLAQEARMQLEYLDALRRRSDAEIEEKLRSKPKLGSLPSQYSAPDKLEMASAILSGLRADKRLGSELKHVSRANELLQELLDHYLMLEDFYMVRNVSKAMGIDEHEGSKPEELLQIVELLHNLQSGNHSFSLAANPLRSNAVSGLMNSTAPTPAGVSLGELARRANDSLFGALPLVFHHSLTSTVVDDSFYILKKCSERAFSTVSATAACAILNHVNTVLHNRLLSHLTQPLQEYRKWMQRNQASGIFRGGRRLASMFNVAVSGSMTSSAQSSSGSVGSGSVAPTAGVRHTKQQLALDAQLVLALNNLDVSASHVETLHGFLQGEYQQALVNTDQKGMVTPCLDELAESAQIMRAKLGSFMEDCTLPQLTGILKPLLDRFADTSYEQTVDGCSEWELNDPFMAEFIRVADQELMPLKACLTSDNLVRISRSLLGWATTVIEKMAWKKRFTLWGGLQFDKDVRRLTQFFGGLCSRRTVRDKFSRLRQLAVILQLESLQEIADYWNDHHQQNEQGGNGLWSSSDVRKALKLRVDFNPSVIHQLELS